MRSVSSGNQLDQLDRLETGSRRRVLKRAAIVLASTLFAMVIAELGFRVWLGVRGTPYSATETQAALTRGIDTADAYVPAAAGQRENPPASRGGGILHPYAGGEKLHDTGGVLEYFAQPRSDADYTVLVVGGSVAASWAQDYKGRFRRLLEADPRFEGRRVRILQYAHAAYKQPQQLARVAYLFSLGHRPDAVINLDGFNEVPSGCRNGFRGTHPLYPSAPTWRALIIDLSRVDQGHLDRMVDLRELTHRAAGVATGALDWSLHRSSVLGTYSLARLDAINARRSELQTRVLNAVRVEGGVDPEINGPPFDRSPEKVLDLCVENWFQSSVSLHALCEARGVFYLHVLQPALEADTKPMSEKERAILVANRGWKLGLSRGYPSMRERGRELLEAGVPFHDATRTFAGVEETLFHDPVHFGPEGNHLMSGVIAQAFLEHLP